MKIVTIIFRHPVYFSLNATNNSSPSSPISCMDHLLLQKRLSLQIGGKKQYLILIKNNLLYEIFVARIVLSWLYTIKFLVQVLRWLLQSKLFSVYTSCRKKCLQFLRKKLVDVFTRCSSSNISATLRTCRIDFVTIGLDQRWRTCDPGVVGKKFFALLSTRVQ